MRAKLAIVSGLLLAAGLLATAGSASAWDGGFGRCGGGCFRGRNCFARPCHNRCFGFNRCGGNCGAGWGAGWGNGWGAGW